MKKFKHKSKLTVLLMLILALSVSIFAGCQSSHAGTFEGRKKEIEKAWFEKEGSELVWSTDLENAKYKNVRYYGTYNGYDILFKNRGSILAVAGVMEIAGEVIESGGLFDIYAYKDGQFYELRDVYDKGLISAEDISEIAKVHRDYEEGKHTADPTS